MRLFNQARFSRKLYNASYSTTVVMEEGRKLSERLSQFIRPVHYELILKQNANADTFEGNVKIDISLKEEQDFVNLHTKSLDINNVKFYKDNSEFPLSMYQEKKDLEQLCLYFDYSLDPGDYKISIDFSGKCKGKIVGYYSSRLSDNRTMYASKFQPTYARQAFPCFDEPDFKATYDISIVKPPSLIALSNMNEKYRKYDSETKLDTVKFASSVPMSTYLVCFVICDFDYKETVINSNGIGKNFKLRSFAQKQETYKIDFAQDIGKRATEFYINYYKVPFPLPKLDMIAIPDYVSGATEHWGLITYRETSFLIDESKASASNKISVANTIAHELAHMWFGNLVTMKWWDDVWLNEGFASYMQVKSLNAIEPTWTMLDQFLPRTLHSALKIDAKLSSHPIVQTVETPDEITAIFDSISYNKGASILRMLEGFIGETNFQDGVSYYLKKYAFGNTVTQDLLSSLGPFYEKDHPDINITYVMDTWTKQMGYPVLTVTPGKANTFVITQKRFFAQPDVKSPSDSQFNYRWYVPITYSTNTGVKSETIWFPDTKDSVEITLKPDETWLKINNNQVGYYRVNYSNEMWQNLIIQLKENPKQFSISDRAHLLDDVFALAEASLVPYATALDLSTYLKAETDYVPWETAASIFADLSDKLKNSLGEEHPEDYTEGVDYELLEKHVQHLIQPLYEKQSWDKPESGVIDKLLRSRILSLATRYDVPGAREKARQLFLSWFNSHGTPDAVEIDSDLRSCVYYYGLMQAPNATGEWDKMWEIYFGENDVQEKSKLRHALSAPRHYSLLVNYLVIAWYEENIRSQDYFSVLHEVALNPLGNFLVWADLRARWAQIAKRFTLNSRYLGNTIPAVTKNFNSEEKLEEMESFFAQYPEAGAGAAARRRALEAVRTNLRWQARARPALTAWLAAHTDN